MADLFSIGRSGLRAAQTHLSVTGQNITNVNTPGYSRQTVIQTTMPASFTGAGYMGNGAKLVDVQRIYNQFLTDQVRNTTSAAASNQAYNSQIEQLNGMLASSSSGINKGIQGYFDALQTTIEDPVSTPARQLFLSETQGLTERFNSVHEQLSTQNRFLNEQMGVVAGQVNRLAQAVAGYNDAISIAAANGAMPNDLLDARDEAVRQLSAHVGVAVVKQDDHSISLFVGSGQPLVVGNVASQMNAIPGRDDPSRVSIQLVSGGSAQDITRLVSGGELGGMLDYREDVLDLSFNALGRMSLALASESNQQLGKGLDLNGQVGRPLFNDINSPAHLELRSRGWDGNQSDTRLDVHIADTSQLSTSDYELTFTSDTEFTVRRVNDNQQLGPYSLAAPEPDPDNPLASDALYPVFDGLDLSRQSGAGGFTEGDRYLLTPTRFAADQLSVVMSDPQQLALAGPVVSEADLNNRGTGRVSQPILTDGPQPMALDALKGMGVVFSYEDDTLTLSSTATPAKNITLPGGADHIDITPGKTTEVSWTIDGHHFSMVLSGGPQQGDSFRVEFNEGGVADNRNALLMSELQSRPVLGQADAGRGFSLLDGYGDLVQKVATFTAQSRTEGEATQAMLVQATNNRNSVSAVNLDEEAVKLIQFEQYYNASAQIIQVARTVFDTLINAVR